MCILFFFIVRLLLVGFTEHYRVMKLIVKNKVCVLSIVIVPHSFFLGALSPP